MRRALNDYKASWTSVYDLRSRVLEAQLSWRHITIARTCNALCKASMGRNGTVMLSVSSIAVRIACISSCSMNALCKTSVGRDGTVLYSVSSNAVRITCVSSCSMAEQLRQFPCETPK